MALQYGQWVVGSMGDCNQVRDGEGAGLEVGSCECVAGNPNWVGRTASILCNISIFVCAVHNCLQ